jgi:hypothetical protein
MVDKLEGRYNIQINQACSINKITNTITEFLKPTVVGSNTSTVPDKAQPSHYILFRQNMLQSTLDTCAKEEKKAPAQNKMLK